MKWSSMSLRAFSEAIFVPTTMSKISAKLIKSCKTLYSNFQKLSKNNKFEFDENIWQNLTLNFLNSKTLDSEYIQLSFSISLSSLSALFDAFIGFKIWADSEILAERNIVLKSKNAQYARHLKKYRTKARDKVLRVFQYVKAAEKKAFEVNSFFAQKNEKSSSFSFLTSDFGMD